MIHGAVIRSETAKRTTAESATSPASQAAIGTARTSASDSATPRARGTLTLAIAEAGLAEARAELGRACEAYDWASRMIGSASRQNPIIRDGALRLLDAGDAALRRAARELPAALPAPGGNTAPSR
jgi:hypothetical protein